MNSSANRPILLQFGKTLQTNAFWMSQFVVHQLVSMWYSSMRVSSVTGPFLYGIWKDLNAHLRTSCSFLRSSLATRCTVLVTHLREDRVAGVLALVSFDVQNASTTLYTGIWLVAFNMQWNTTSKEGPIGSWSSREFTDMVWYVVLNGCSGSSLKNSSLVTTGTFASRVPVTAKAFSRLQVELPLPHGHALCNCSN